MSEEIGGQIAAREEEIRVFLEDAGWGSAERIPLAGDASTRRYVRLALEGRSAMLLDQPQYAEASTASLEASPEERAKLGYNALARLAGADCARFVAIAAHLRELGLSAPEIYAADTKNGLLLLEDLGDALYADLFTQDADEDELYSAAIDVLVALHERPAPDALNGAPFFPYDETALLAEADLLTEWFVPFALRRNCSDDEKVEHRALWREALGMLAETPRRFVHRDYHAQNLLWLPQRPGIARVGLVDFQDAVAGHAAYDVVSLLEDARRDVPEDLAAAMIGHYLKASGLEADREDFLAAAAILSAQRNAKIIGIFARLAERDGKPRYLPHLPRVWRYMERDLEHPALITLKTWYDRRVPREARIGPFQLRGDAH